MIVLNIQCAHLTITYGVLRCDVLHFCLTLFVLLLCNNFFINCYLLFLLFSILNDYLEKIYLETVTYDILNSYLSSILGPLFYIIYANDFSRASELLFTIMFADDTSGGQSYGNVCQLLNGELEKCDNWIKANKLTLNLKKKTFHDFP